MKGLEATKESVKADCEECGAEFIITVLYKPGFMDLKPTCPYCQHKFGEG